MANRFTIDAIFKGIDEFSAPVGKMNSSLNRFRRNFEISSSGFISFTSKINGAVKGMALGMAGIATGSGIAGIAIKGMIDKGDALANRSARLQFPVEGLQEWGHVAEHVGVTTEDFDSALDKFANNLGGAKLGMGPLKAALKDTNPALLNQLTHTKDISEAMKIYLNAIGGVKDPSKQAALATAAFGRSASGMVNVANLGADGISRLIKEQDQNGVMTAAQAKAYKELDDTIMNLTATGAGFLNSVLAPMVPQITALVEKTREWLLAHRDEILQKIQSFFTFLVDTLPTIIEWFKRGLIIVGIFEGAAIALKAFNAILLVTTGIMEVNPFFLIVSALAGIIAFWPELKNFFGGFIDYLHEVDKTASHIIHTIRGDESTSAAYEGLYAPGTRLSDAPIVSPHEAAAKEIAHSVQIGKGQLHVSTDKGIKAKVVRNIGGLQIATNASGTF